MKLIIGLGNPGTKYENTRHNIGFMVLDALAKKHNVSFTLDKTFNGYISWIRVGSEKVCLLKPTTYMNLSGDSVSKVMNYYQIETPEILVVVDDIDIETGKLRLRESGGHGGHNGLRDIHKHLQTPNYKRLRIGIDQDKSMPLDQYVLGNFSKQERIIVDIAVNHAVDAIDLFISGTPYLDVMTKYNTIKVG